MRGTRAHGYVRALLQDVDDLVGESDIEAHAGMAFQELRYQGQQEVMAEGDVGVNAYASQGRGAFAHAALGLVQVGQDAHSSLVELAAFGGELELSRRAVHQSRTKTLLHAGDQLADRGRCHAQGAGGGGKAPLFDDPHEDFQFARSIDLHLSLPGELNSQMLCLRPVYLKVGPEPMMGGSSVTSFLP